MKSHLNEKYKYSCVECNEKFKGKKQLSQHMKTHQERNDEELDEKFTHSDSENDDDLNGNSSIPAEQDPRLSLDSTNEKDALTDKQSSEQVAESKRNLRKSKYPRKVKIEFPKKQSL